MNKSPSEFHAPPEEPTIVPPTEPTPPPEPADPAVNDPPAPGQSPPIREPIERPHPIG